MKFPSLKNLAENAIATIKRFPLELLFALTATIAATIKIQVAFYNQFDGNWCARVMMMANFGLLLSLSATLYTESKNMPAGKRTFIKTTAAVIGVLLIFLVNPGEREADYLRFFMFSLSLHMLVAFAAFTGTDHIQGFWQFNRTIFLRFLTSALYALVLFLGLAAAIGASSFLFNLKISWNVYSILFMWIAGMFSTMFFLAGVPADTKALEEDFTYPKGLKIFTQYVLIPLATIYVAILLAYEGKILVQWELPQGVVSNLILGYAVFGILSLLLVYPVREEEENRWLKTYAKSFYFLLIPLLGLLFTAAFTRIFKYGFTEMRYFLILLACWLLFITVYFLIDKKQNIKLIPISLFVLTLLSIYGPQSAFSVSLNSQRRVLVGIFSKYHSFKDGKLIPLNAKHVSKKDGHRAAAIVDYLVTKHNLTSLQPYFTADLEKKNDSITLKKGERQNIATYQLRFNRVAWAKKQLGLSHFNGYYREGSDDISGDDLTASYDFSLSNEFLTNVKGYDYLIDQGIVNDTTSNNLNGVVVKKMMQTANGVYTLKLNNSVFAFDIKPQLDKLIRPANLKSYQPNKNDLPNAYILPENTLVMTKQTDKFEVTFKVNRINFIKNDNVKWDIYSISFVYLVNKK